MADELIDVLVETPKRSRSKYEWDHDRAGCAWTAGSTRPRSSRRTTATSQTPRVPTERRSTPVLNEDGTFPGCWVLGRPIGVFWITYAGDGEHQAREAKILSVPDQDPDWAEVRDLSDLPKHQLEEISHFFDVYKDLKPSRTPSPGGYEGRVVALQMIAESRLEGKKAK